jgi:uncharacterized membrane protein YcaP (DUF421 family)
MDLPLPVLLAAVAARTAIVLLVLVGAIRILGKRQVGGMHIIDLVMVLLIGNAVQNALTFGSGVLGVGLVSAGVLLAIESGIGILFVRRPWLETRVFGEPTVIGSDGRLDRRAMQREGVEEDEVMQAMRDQGLSDLSQVHLAMLEDDGSISIVPKEREEVAQGGEADEPL